MRHWKFYAGFFFVFLGIVDLISLLLAEYPTFDKPLSDIGIYGMFGMVMFFLLATAVWVDYREMIQSKVSEQKKEGEGESC